MEKADTTAGEDSVIRFFFKTLSMHSRDFWFLERRTVASSEATTGCVLYEKVFLKNSQNSQETPVPESLFFNKDPGWGLQLY